MKSPLTQIIIKIFAVVLFGGAMFYFLIAPKLSDLVKNQIEIEKLGYDLKTADQKLSALREIDKDRLSLDQTKDDVFSLLPEDASASSFILNVESMSRQIGVVVNSLSVSEIKASKTVKKNDDSDSAAKPAATAPKPTAEKALSFTASFTSDYAKGQSFLKSLEMLPRFNIVETLNIGNYKLDDQTMNFKVEGKIFYGR